MAATVPPINIPVVDGGGSANLPWHRFFSDIVRRMGGSQDITMSVVGSSLTFTYRAPDGTVKTGTVALT